MLCLLKQVMARKPFSLKAAKTMRINDLVYSNELCILSCNELMARFKNLINVSSFIAAKSKHLINIFAKNPHFHLKIGTLHRFVLYSESKQLLRILKSIVYRLSSLLSIIILKGTGHTVSLRDELHSFENELKTKRTKRNKNNCSPNYISSNQLTLVFPCVCPL